MRTAVCPGSFDPVTKGHLDVITRTSLLFDEVIVLVSVNSAKQPMFSTEERMAMLRKVTAELSNVRVDYIDCLLADYVRKVKAAAIVKGLRAVSDFEYEFQMALTNKKLYPEAETVFLTANSENMYLSSNIVKQIAELGGDISDFVPECVLQDILKKINDHKKERS